MAYVDYVPNVTDPDRPQLIRGQARGLRRDRDSQR